MIFGLLGLLVMGFTLGLLGGGGSILSVPILVYLMGYSPQSAVSLSFLLVGIGALSGLLQGDAWGRVQQRVGLHFGVLSVGAVILMRSVLFPAIPEQLGPLKKDTALLVLFALTMVVAALAMLRDGRKDGEQQPEASLRTLWTAGFGVGSLAGLIGAGGGFLIVPALLRWGGLRVHAATATTLAIIAVNSLAGVLAAPPNMSQGGQVLSMLGVTVLGAGIGSWMSPQVDAQRLKKGFGWLIMAVGVAVLAERVGVFAMK